MTLREQLQGKATRFFWVCGAFFLLLAGAILLAGAQGKSAVVLLLFALFLLPILPLNLYFRCPRCSSGLGSVIAHFGPARSLGKAINFCPFCGAGLDDELRP